MNTPRIRAAAILLGLAACTDGPTAPAIAGHTLDATRSPPTAGENGRDSWGGFDAEALELLLADPLLADVVSTVSDDDARHGLAELLATSGEGATRLANLLATTEWAAEVDADAAIAAGVLRLNMHAVRVAPDGGDR